MAELMWDNMEADQRAEQEGTVGSPFNKGRHRWKVQDLFELDPVF